MYDFISWFDEVPVPDRIMPHGWLTPVTFYASGKTYWVLLTHSEVENLPQFLQLSCLENV